MRIEILKFYAQSARTDSRTDYCPAWLIDIFTANVVLFLTSESWSEEQQGYFLDRCLFQIYKN